MSERRFGKVDNKQFSITALGAAVVEAMPDRKLMAKIKRAYKRTGYIPESALFPETKQPPEGG